MPLVKMLTTSATPERILDAGKVYNLPGSLAKRLCQSSEAKDGEGKVIGTVGPFASPAPAGSKVTPLPVRPDPDDVPDYDEDSDPGLVDDED